MKKLLATLLAAATIVSANAQDEMEAFKHMSASAEVGMMGIGINVAMPVVSNHLVCVLGYNLPAGPTFKKTYRLKANTYKWLVQEMNAEADRNPDKGLQKIDIKSIGSEVSVDAESTLKFGNFKVLFEYYPSTKSSFHLTAGAMIGQDKFIKLHGFAEEAVQNTYNIALSNQEKLYGTNIPEDQDIRYSLRYNLDGATYCLNDDVELNGHYVANKVKPYFGLGFGQAVPKKRVGCQFEMGLWYQGNTTISSRQKQEYDPEANTLDGIVKLAKVCPVYPQVMVRIVGKLF